MQRNDNDNDKSTSKTTARYGALFGGAVAGGVAGILGHLYTKDVYYAFDPYALSPNLRLVVNPAKVTSGITRGAITFGLVGAGLGYLCGKRLGLFAISRTKNEINQSKSLETDQPSLHKK